MQNQGAVTTSDHEQMRQALDRLVAAAATALPPADFESQLTAISERYLGAEADSNLAQTRRRVAIAAYDRLLAQKDVDRHHHIERLAEALDGLAELGDRARRAR